RVSSYGRLSAMPDRKSGVSGVTARDSRMEDIVLPLSAATADDPDIVGPKAANLARLDRAGLPTPGGLCLTAAAYRRRIAHLGLTEMLGQFASADIRTQRRLSVEIRLSLYEQPIADDVAEPLLAMWHANRERKPGPWAVRSSALIEDRADANFAGQFESFLG